MENKLNAKEVAMRKSCFEDMIALIERCASELTLTKSVRSALYSLRDSIQKSGPEGFGVEGRAATELDKKCEREILDDLSKIILEHENKFQIR